MTFEDIRRWVDANMASQAASGVLGSALTAEVLSDAILQVEFERFWREAKEIRALPETS